MAEFRELIANRSSIYDIGSNTDVTVNDVVDR